MHHKDVIANLAHMPEALLSRLSGLSEEQLRAKPAADVFSVLESICHLRDIEVEGYGRRLGLLLREDNPRLPDLDGTALASERRYNDQELRPALEAFLNMRRRCLEILASVTPEQLERPGYFENVGKITLAGLLERWAGHDQEHLQELDALLPMLQAPQTGRPKPSRSLTA